MDLVIRQRPQYNSKPPKTIESETSGSGGVTRNIQRDGSLHGRGSLGFDESEEVPVNQNQPNAKESSLASRVHIVAFVNQGIQAYDFISSKSPIVSYDFHYFILIHIQAPSLLVCSIFNQGTTSDSGIRSLVFVFNISTTFLEFVIV